MKQKRVYQSPCFEAVRLEPTAAICETSTFGVRFGDDEGTVWVEEE